MTLRAVAVVCLVLSACAGPRRRVGEPVALLAPPPVAMPLPYEEWPRRLEQPRTPAEARMRREAFDARPPDGRFVRAIDELSPLFGGTAAPVELRRAGDKWFVVSGPSTVAILNAWPSFAELLAAVASLVPGSDGPRPSAAALPLRSGDALLGELDAINAEWKASRGSAAFLGRAAHAWIWLSFENHDETGMADELWSRTIAIAAAAKANGALHPQDEALLMHALGYANEALALTATLPATDAVRRFILGERSQLSELGSPTSGERYLWARLVAQQRSAVATRAALGDTDPKQLDAAMLHAHLRSEVFDVQAGLAAAALQADLSQLRRFGAAVNDTSEGVGLFALLERGLAEIKEPAQGPFDARMRRVWVRANVVSDLHHLIEFARKRGGGTATTDEVLALCGPAPSGPLRDVEAFFVTRVRRPSAEQWEEAGDRIETGLGSLGAEAQVRYMNDWAGSMWMGQTTLHKARAVARRMDTRPSHRAALLSLLFARTYDRAWQERMARRVLAVTSVPATRDWLSRLVGDWPSLEKSAADAGATVDDRMRAVEHLLGGGVINEDEASKRLRAIWESSPDEATGAYERWAWNRHRWKDLLFLEEWLTRHPEEDTLRSAHYRASLARALWKTGRDDEAWGVLQPAIAFGPSDALLEAALVQLELGNKEQALSFERRIAAAYPGTSTALSLSIFWRMGAFAEAGALIAAQPKTSLWSDKAVGTFADCFHGRPPSEISAALAAIPQSVSHGRMLLIAERLLGRSRPELAAAIVEHRELGTDTDLILRGFEILRRARGAEAAKSWLSKQKVEPPSRAYRRLLDVRLLGVLADPPPQLRPDDADAESAFLQALALAATQQLSGPAAVDLRARAQKHSAEAAWSATRVLLGIDPMAKLAAASASPGFVEAVAAEGAGRTRDAVEGYLDVVDTQKPASAEFKWADARLGQLLVLEEKTR